MKSMLLDIPSQLTESTSLYSLLNMQPPPKFTRAHYNVPCFIGCFTTEASKRGIYLQLKYTNDIISLRRETL